jgi:hypothetical protein
LLALPWPLLGASAFEPFLGVGDIVFTALYVASARQHSLPIGRTVVAALLAFGATLACVIGFQVPIPVLPLLGLAIVVAHPAARSPAPADRVRGFAIAALVVAVVAVLLLRR